MLSVLCVAQLTLVYARNYRIYSSGGYRNEARQADWRGMARFMADSMQPGDVPYMPIPNRETWAAAQFKFYEDQLRPELGYWHQPTLDLVRKPAETGRSAWFVFTEGHKLPAETVRHLASAGKWAPFYGGAIVYLPAKAAPVDPSKRVFDFVARRQADAVLAFDRKVGSADMVLTGSVGRTATITSQTPTLPLTLGAGITRATVEYHAPADYGTTLSLYWVVEPGRWNSALDFSGIEPGSAHVRFPIFRSEPYLFLHHNGSVVYRFFLERSGDFDLILEAKNDKPGPIHLRVKAGEGSVREFLFDLADNEFSTRRQRVQLAAGPNTMRITYDSFTRIKEKLKVADDEANSFEFARWKLNWVGGGDP